MCEIVGFCCITNRAIFKSVRRDIENGVDKTLALFVIQVLVSAL